MTGRDRTGLYALAGLVFVVTVAAFVVLQLAGKDTGDLLALVGPVIAGLFLGGILGGKIEETKQVAETVKEQTNGQLDARFRAHAEQAATSAASTALQAAGVGTVTESRAPEDPPRHAAPTIADV